MDFLKREKLVFQHVLSVFSLEEKGVRAVSFKNCYAYLIISKVIVVSL